MSYIFYLSRLENLNVTHQCKCLYILRHQRTRKYFNFTKTRLHRSAICVSSHLFCIFAIFFIHSLYKYSAFQAMNTECQRHSKKSNINIRRTNKHIAHSLVVSKETYNPPCIFILNAYTVHILHVLLAFKFIIYARYEYEIFNLKTIEMAL